MTGEPVLTEVKAYNLVEVTNNVKVPVTGSNIPKETATADGTMEYMANGNVYTKVSDDSIDGFKLGGNLVIKKDTDGNYYEWDYTNNTFRTVEEKTNKVEGKELPKIKEISAGSNNSIALAEDGTVWAWGQNGNSQLGLNSITTCETLAKQVDLTNLEEETVKQVEAGDLASYILTTDGFVYACGYSGNYLCGNTTSSYVYIPTRINNLSKITKISAGNNRYAVAIDIKGKAYAWGHYVSGYTSGQPAQIVLQNSQNIVDIEATDDFGAMYKFADGTVGYSSSVYPTVNYSSTYYYYRGRKYYRSYVSGTTPPVVKELKDTILINGGNKNYIIAESDGTVWGYGNNSNGELGDRTTTATASDVLEDITKAYISLNRYEITLTEGETNNLSATYNYGFNLFKSGSEAIPMEYTSLNGDIATVDASGKITAKKSGKTYIEAKAEDGTTLRVIVNVLSAKEVVTPKVSVGNTHTVALKADGTVWGFGNNSNGELGSAIGVIAEPETISISETIKDIAAGDKYTLMLTTDGKVLAMGSNVYGQLGNNTKENSISTVTVQKQVVDKDGNISYVDLDNIEKISAIGYTSYALDKDGNMYIWGNNANVYATKVNTYGFKVNNIDGNLILTEDGRVWKITSSTALNFVRNLEDITQISSATYAIGTNYGYNMALDGDGKVYTWVNSSNANNKATGTETTIPTQVVIPTAEDEKIVDIQAGIQFAYAMSDKGNVYSWGQNSTALGRTGTYSTPAKINEEQLNNIESIAATTFGNGARRAFAVTRTGSVYGFGANGGNCLIGTGETDAYYYESKLVGESYAGFVIDGVPTTRLYMNVNDTIGIDIQASLLDAFNLRLNTAETTEETDFEWTIFNSDLVSLSGNGDTRKLTSGSIIGEATIVATDKISGKVAKLFIDVKPTNTEVAPKIETTGNHTVSLKADGTVWVWGTNNNGVLGLDSTEYGKTIKEPEQARIAKRIMVSEPILKEEETPDVITPEAPATDTPVDSEEPEEPVEEVRPVYVDEDGNEYYKVGDNYTDLDGKLVIRKDTDNNLYKWNNVENCYELEDLTNEDGSPIIVTDIATSNNHTLLLTKDGDVYSFGYNYYGQLGYSTSPNNYQCLPKKVNGLKDIVKIATGDNISLALDKYGRLWAFGKSGYTTYPSGRPVYNPIINSIIPKRMKVLDGVDIVDLAKSAIDITNEYVLTNEGVVKALKLYGTSLATGTTIEGIDGKVIKVTKTSGSQNNGHTAFLTENGTLYTIGRGTSGQLGNGDRKNSSGITGDEFTAVQVQDTQGSNLGNIRDVYVGETHTIAIDKSGELYTWGSNTYGELRSTESTAPSIVRAYKVEEDERIKKAILVSAGNGHSIVVDETGFAYAWGLGTSGQLGNALGVNSRPAVRVGVEGIRLETNHITLKSKDNIEINGYNKQLNLIYDPEIEISSVQSKDTRVASVRKNADSEAKLTVSGVNAGTTTVLVNSVDANNFTYTSIIQVTVLPTIADIADDVILPLDRTLNPMTVSGSSHTLILKSDGTVLAYGDNAYGQTAGKATYSDRVNVVKFPEEAASIISVSAGDDFSVALDRNGNVYTWGNNRNGELGLGTTDFNRHNEPTRVPTLRNIVKIAAGAKHCIALDKDGYVYTWGNNTSGSLGTGGTASVTIPVQVNNVANVIDIAAGTDHSMVLTADGSVYTTGKNGLGQLGVEYIVSKRNFEKININAKIAFIEAGNKTSFAIDVDRNLWVWGNNADGQLGIGSSQTQINIPTKCNIANVQSVSAGTNHTQIVTTSGELYTAGLNDCGQLGIGANTSKVDTFTRVSKLFGSNVMNSNAGETYSTVIDKDGKVYGFGDYNHGNTDRVSRTKSFEPILISNETSYIDNQDITLNIDSTYELNVNGKYKLNVLHKDKSEFTYQSFNEEIAEVDEDGTITGIAVGTTLVRITDEDGKVSTAIVKVVPVDAIQAPTIEGGDKFTIVTDKAGTPYLFGNKENIIDSNIPKIIDDSTSFKTVKAGEDFIVGINHDGTVWTLGDNTKGQLGIELDKDYSTGFVRLNRNTIKGINQVDAGNGHAIALDELGTVYVWGDNSKGQLCTDSSIDKVTSPMIIRPSENRIISVSAGGDYSAVVDTEGKVYIIGKAYILRDILNEKGEVIGQEEVEVNAVQEVTNIQNAVKVAVGKDKTIILTNTGSVFEVTNRSKKGFAIATQVRGLSGTNRIIVDIATNSDTFMALTNTQELYTWGNNANGQLGANSNSNSINSIQKVATDVFTIGGGKTNTYYINTQGEVMAAGLNTEGQLGNGTRGNDKATTKEFSKTYTKVGNREFAIKELKVDGTLNSVEAVRIGRNWTVLTGKESIKELEREINQKLTLISEAKEFNAFREIVGNVSDYEFELSNTNIANLELPTTDADYAKVEATNLGKTVLTAKNKVTNEEKELTIIIVEDKKLRVEDIIVIDSDDAKFESEPNTEDLNIDFVIRVEGSKDSGTLNVTLELEGDKLTLATDGDKEYTITPVLDTEDLSKVVEWVVEGLDLTKSTQTLTLTLETEAGEEIEYTVVIRKEVNVKVNDEVLAPEEKENVVTYTKFINPEDAQAKFEITVLDSTKKIVLKDKDGNKLAESKNGEAILKIDDLSVPEKENEFIIEITDKDGKVEKSILKILKSSIESITVVDATNPKGHVTAGKVEGTDGYVYNFEAEIDGSNKDAEVTLNIINKNVTNITIDGVETAVSNTITFNTEKVDEAIEIILTVLDPITNTTYTEKYKLTIHKVGANTEISEIVLQYIDGDKEGLPEDCKFKFDGNNTYSVVLHNKDLDLEDYITFGFKVTLKDSNAYVKQASHSGFGSQGIGNINSSPDSKADNKNSVSYKIVVTAENGRDTKEYNVVIYKESEDTTIKTINTNSMLSDGTIKQKEAETKDGINYIGKVVKNSDSYEVEIQLNDSYATIANIKFAGTEDKLTLISEKSDSKIGKYTYTLPVDKIGTDIEITVKPEFSGTPEETYILKTDYLDDNANFGSIKLGDKILDITEDTLSESIKAEDSDKLNVIAESVNATIEIYDVDPASDGATPIALGKGEVTIDTLGINKGAEKTVYIKVVSEDEQNITIKQLTVKRLSDNTNIKTVIFTVGDEAKEVEYTPGKVIEISDKYISNATNVKVTLEDSNATALVEGEDNAVGAVLDLLTNNTINVEVEAQDGTKFTHTITIKVLSSSTEITKEIQDKGIVLKQNNDFIKDEDNENSYSVEVKNTGDDVDLVITNDKATIRLAILSVDGEAVTEKTYVTDNKIVVNSAKVTDVEVEVTAEDGTQTVYTITVIPEDPVLSEVKVIGSASTIEKVLTTDELKAMSAIVRVHPDSNKATIYLKPSENYVLKEVSAITNPNMTTEDGKELQGNYTGVIGTPYTTITVDLLDSSISDTTKTIITINSENGKTETLNLNIVRGSTEAKLDSVIVKGTTTEESVVTEYDRNITASASIDSEDSLYNIIPKPANYGTYKLYRISDENKDVLYRDIDLTKEEEINETSQIALTTKDQRFIIVVTAEFGGAEKRYEFKARKVNNDTSIKDFKVTVNGVKGEVEKHLVDFGEFDKDGNINIYVPNGVSKINISDLVLSNEFAKAEWRKGTEPNYTDALQVGANMEFVLPTGQVYIKVTTESGVEKEYCLNIKIATEDTSLTDMKLDDITNVPEKAITIEAITDTQREATITEDTFAAKETSTSNGVVRIKVTEVNGHIVNETIATEDAKIGSNALELALDRDYTYTDAEGVEHTIPANAVREIKIVTTVTSIAYELYPDYYEATSNQKEYELTIKRLLADTNIIITIDGETSDTVIDTKTTSYNDTIVEDGKTVYVYKVQVPSTQEKLVINNVKTHNESAIITHTKVGNDIYTEEEPYSINFSSVDKASVTEDFTVENPLGNEVVYRLVVTKYSGNNNIETLQLNENKIVDTNKDDIYETALLSPVDKLDLKLQGIEENAKVEIAIKGVNEETVSVTVGSFDPVDNTITADLMEKLESILTTKGIEIENLDKISISIKIQAEDPTLDAREYTLNIDVVKSNLISINGLNKDGVVSQDSQLTANEFKYNPETNAFETEAIAVPYDTTRVLLNKITCKDRTVITDKDGNVITELNVDLLRDGITKAIINTNLDGIEQQFIVNIRLRSTDTSIKSVSSNGKTTSELDEETQTYVLPVQSTVDPVVKVNFIDTNAHIISAKPILDTVKAEVDSENNTFTILEIKEDTHVDPSAIEKEIDVTITVKAENGNEADYIVTLSRKHVETGLGIVTVGEDFVGQTEENKNKVNFANTDVINRTISSSANGITITSAQLVCSEANAYVENDVGERTEIGTDGVHIDIEENSSKAIKIVVVAEYGNEKTYTLNVRRQAANVAIDGITVNVGERTEEATVAPYEATINVDENPEIIVTTNDPNAKVSEVKVYRKDDSNKQEIANISEIKNNTFTITNLSNLYSDDTTEDSSNDLNRYIISEITVVAEDTNISKTYTLTLNRRHIETGLKDISYTYEQDSEDETAEPGTKETKTESAKLSTEEATEIIISSTATSINFAKVEPSCKEATVKIELDGEEITQTEEGFSVDLAETKGEGNGRIRNMAITVTSESGNIAKYNVSIIRMATNASLEKVLVNGTEIEMSEIDEADLPEGISGVFKANVKDIDKEALIEAISANIFAKVSITDEKYTTIDNDKSYDEKGKYDLSEVTEREVIITIVVTPQDETKESKTYQLILTRLYDSTVLESVSVKPAVVGTVNTDAIVKVTEDFEQKTHSDYYGYNRRTYFKAERITLDTDWTAISIGDLLPSELANTEYKQQYTITRISGDDPYASSEMSAYEIDSAFEMPEGIPVYFKIVTTAESGNQGVYVIEVYKKATNTNLTSIKVDGKEATLDEEDGIYKVNADVRKDSLPIVLTGENNLSKDKTTITNITANGVDVTELLGQNKSGSGKTVQITLQNIVSVLNENKTLCSDLDLMDGKVITLKISVVPEDESIEAREYTLQITRQHRDETIKNIVLNEGKIVTIKGTEYSAEQVVPAAFGYKTYGISPYTYSHYEQRIQVTSALDTVTINAINLTCEYAKGTMTVDGTTYNLPLEEPVDVSLPTEGSSKTIVIHTVAEDGSVNRSTDPKYVILTRLYSDDSIRNIMTQRKYIAVDNNGTPYENNPRYETYSNDYDVQKEETYNIHQDAETSVLTVYANNAKATVNMQLVDVLDRDENSIKTDSDKLTLSYVQGTKSNGYGGYYKYNISNTRVATFDTSNSDARTFVIKVIVQAEDAKNVPPTLEAYVPAEEYIIKVVKQDDSAKIDKVVEISGEEEIDIPVDKEIAHYNFIEKDILDKNIYTKYITAETEVVPTKVYAESKFAKVELYNTDPRSDESSVAFAQGIGTVTYDIATPELWTRIFVKITAEDEKTTEVYEIWFVKKSETDDVSIKGLYVYEKGKGIDEETYEVKPAEDGNYYIEISDSIKEMKTKLIPNYELANASINGQPFKWQESTEIVSNFETATIDEFGRVKIDLKIRIPAEQSTSGEDVVNTKTLFITMVSTDNGIEKIETENPADEITPADKPQTNEKYPGTNNTYTILLSGEPRDQIDLTIVALSPKATVGLYDLDDNLQVEDEGTLNVLGLEIDTQGVTVYKVKVKPQEGEAKEYYIEIVPKDSQAELKKLTIGEREIELESGVYEYHISHLGLEGIKDIYALATANSVIEGDGENGSATVKIYTKDDENGSGEQPSGEATLTGVDLDNTMYITVTVLSPNKTRTNTYHIWLKDVDDDRTIQEITYTDIDGTIKGAEKLETTKEGYDGSYEIVLNYDQTSTDISVTASSELARVIADGISKDSNTITITKDVSSMTEDIILDIEVIAESNNRSKYELIIKKPTQITGKIITENADKNYGGVEVKFVNVNDSEEVITTETKEDGTYNVEVPIGTYNMVIEKSGYLTYTMTNIPTSYGVRTYTGNTYLVAGDVYGNDGYIDLRDLTKVNKLARNKTAVKGEDDANRIYDLNEDGAINQLDIDIMFKNYNKKASSTEYIRMIEVNGNVLDAINGDNPLGNTNITLREKNTTDEYGNFEYENLPLGEYELIVTAEDGTILGQSTVTITEGTAYSIKDNIITVTPSKTASNITVRVNGTGAFISEYGKASDRDFTPPTITNVTAEVKEDKVEITAVADDTTLGELANIEFYYVTTNEAGEESATKFATITNGVVGKTNATVTANYKPSNLAFDQKYKIKVVATDKGGNASKESYIEITDNVIRNEEDLIKLSNNVNAANKADRKTYEGETVILVNDLDLSTEKYSSRFAPIGNSAYKKFAGTFIGSGFDETDEIGHIIKLNINIDDGYAGLFGYTDGATIKNIGIEGEISATGDYVGSMVGKAINTEIENCYNAATIKGNNYVGGIIGQADKKAVISNCYNSGDTTGEGQVGGIVGRLSAYKDTKIENCYNVGEITGTDLVGQIIGWRNQNAGNVAEVINCYYINGDRGIGRTGDPQEGEQEIEDTTILIDVVNLKEIFEAMDAYVPDDLVNPINNGNPILQWQQTTVKTRSKTKSKTKRKETDEDSEDLVLPVNEEYTISSEFGTRVHPVTGEVGKMHYGIDIAISAKSEVLSIAEGTVTYAGENGGYGYCIEIEHTINGEKVYSFYAHLSQIDVEVGETVGEGQIIALSGGVPGTEGAGTSTGAHLHFEIRTESGLYSSAVDPRTYFEF